MNVRLIDCDNTGFPNLALMKLSAWYKKGGHNVTTVYWDGNLQEETGFNKTRTYVSSKVKSNLCGKNRKNLMRRP